MYQTVLTNRETGEEVDNHWNLQQYSNLVSASAPPAKKNVLN